MTEETEVARLRRIIASALEALGRPGIRYNRDVDEARAILSYGARHQGPQTGPAIVIPEGR